MMGWIPNALGFGSSSPSAKPGAAIFSQEGPQFYQQAYQHNAPFATKGPYITTLSPEEESAFRSWKPGTPFVWKGDNLIDTRSGQLIFAPSPKGED